MKIELFSFYKFSQNMSSYEASNIGHKAAEAGHIVVSGKGALTGDILHGHGAIGGSIYSHNGTEIGVGVSFAGSITNQGDIYHIHGLSLNIIHQLQ